MPTILLVTANDPDARLHKLSEEGKEIQRTLNSATGRDFDVALLPDTSIRDLIEEFKVPNRQIEILHYAGHADGQTLRLADNDADASALAEKIRLQGTVKLVFLNGCATKGQVTFFHAAGVPFVIATARPVGDEKAHWLSTQFYQYLTLRRSLRGAMEEVVIDAKRLTKKIWFRDDRGISAFSDEAPAEPAEFEWGLYVKPGQEAADYSLPFSSRAAQQASDLRHTAFLDKLLFALENVSGAELAEIKKLTANIRRGGNVPDNTKIAELLKVLPYTLGVRLRQIVADPNERNDDYYRGLLYDFVMFFETLLHHSVALLAAQVWQDKEKTFAHPPADVKTLHNFLHQNRLMEPPESYLPALEMLTNWLRSANPEAPLPLGDAQWNYLRSPKFREASDFFFLQKQYFWQRVRRKEEETLEHCVIAQAHVNEAFGHFSFLVQHVMASVRGINVINFRHLPQDFDPIENIVSRLVVSGSEPEPMPGRAMMENKSVLSFVGGELGIGLSSLNLFPFVIDRNVFTGKPNNEVDLYLFAGYFSPKAESGGSDCFHFVSVKNPEMVWQFDENSYAVSLLHLGEKTSETHEQNHLMANAWEFKNYLTEYRNQFLKLVEV